MGLIQEKYNDTQLRPMCNPDAAHRVVSRVNGASDLAVSVFRESGKHARFAVGVDALPLDACVEVAAIFLAA